MRKIAICIALMMALLTPFVGGGVAYAASSCSASDSQGFAIPAYLQQIFQVPAVQNGCSSWTAQNNNSSDCDLPVCQNENICSTTGCDSQDTWQQLLGNLSSGSWCFGNSCLTTGCSTQ